MRDNRNAYSHDTPTETVPIRRKITSTQPLHKKSSANSNMQANASRIATPKQRAKRAPAQGALAGWQCGGGGGGGGGLDGGGDPHAQEDDPPTLGLVPDPLGVPLERLLGRKGNASAKHTSADADGTIARAPLWQHPHKLRHCHTILAEMLKMSPCGHRLPTYGAIDRSHKAVCTCE